MDKSTLKIFWPKMPYVVLILVGMYLLSPFSHVWFPQTVDGEYYAARAASYFVSIKEGSIPPRLSPTFYSGLGYPVLNFNYPLPGIVISMLLALGATVQTSLKIVAIGTYVLASVGMYELLRKVKFSYAGALTGSLMYSTAPYYIFDVFHRFSIGEMIMFAMVPVVIMVISRVGDDRLNPKIATVIYTAFLLAHNLFTLISIPVITLFVLFHFGKKTLVQNKSLFVCAVAISCFFWVPALSEMRYTVLSKASINNDYREGLLGVANMLKLPGLFEPTKPRTNDADQPGYAHLFILLISTWIAMVSRKIKIKKTWVILLVVTNFCILFLVTKQSLFVWETFSFLRFLQHPTRLYFVFILATAYLSAWVMDRFKWKVGLGLCLAALTIANYQFFDFRPRHFIPLDDSFLYQYPLTSAAANEFDPIWYDRKQVEAFLEKNPGDIISIPSSQVTLVSKRHFTKKYHVTTSQPVTIIEKTLYFPGWETRKGGSLINTMGNADRYHGLINYDLEPGEHTITTQWTQNTMPRYIGNGLSIAGLIGLVALKKPKKQ